MLAGLGNCGEQYADTRHNVGFRAIDAIAAENDFANWRHKFDGACANGKLGTHEVLLLKPKTSMNDSGRSIVAAMRFFKIPVQQIFVFYDELDLAAGKLRVRLGGGTAGHNGVSSVVAHVGNVFWRVRIGIGRPETRGDEARYVLDKFARHEHWRIPMFAALAQYATLLVEGRATTYQTRVIEKIRAVVNTDGA